LIEKYSMKSKACISGQTSHRGLMARSQYLHGLWSTLARSGAVWRLKSPENLDEISINEQF
jgi:hypothetical protein